MADYRSPAITAGLLGIFAAASPNVALGATMTVGEASPFALVIPMAAGCLLGGAVGSAVSCMLTRRAYANDVHIDFAEPPSFGTSQMPAQPVAKAPARPRTAPVRNSPVVPRQAVPARPNQIRAQQARAKEQAKRQEKSTEEVRRQGVAATLSERLGRSIPEFDFGTAPSAKAEAPQQQAPVSASPMPQAQSPQATAAQQAYAQQIYAQQRVFNGPPQRVAAGIAGSPDHSQVMLMMGLTGSYDAMSSTGMVMNQTIASQSQAMRVPATPITANPERAARIARSLAAIELGAYPEKRDSSALGEPADGWASSLANMEEKIAETRREEWRQPGPIRPVITDIIGGVDTIDEPAGLEGDTSFIPFKVPAGHPDVVDTNSYVDYLIDDEFSQNSSDAVRDRAHKYFKVLKGGSQTMPRVRTTPARGGAHFRAMEA